MTLDELFINYPDASNWTIFSTEVGDKIKVYVNDFVMAEVSNTKKMAMYRDCLERIKREAISTHHHALKLQHEITEFQKMQKSQEFREFGTL